MRSSCAKQSLFMRLLRLTAIAGIYSSSGFFTYFHFYAHPQQYCGDILVLPNMYEYVIRMHHSLSAWLLPSAGYYSDVALIFLLRSLIVDVHSVLAAAAVAQTALFACVFVFLARALSQDRNKRQLIVMIMPLLCIFMLFAEGEFFQMGITVFHFLAVIYVTLSISLLLHWQSTPQSKLLGALFFLCCAIGYCSDRIFLVWAILPLSVFLCLQWIACRDKKVLIRLATLLCAAAVGKILFLSLQTFMPSCYYDFQMSPTLKRLVKQIGPVLLLWFEQISISFPAGLLSLVSFCGIAFSMKKQKETQTSIHCLFLSPVFSFLLILGLVVACNICAVSSVRIVAARYLLPSIILPIAGGVVLLCLQMRDKFERYSSLALISVLFLCSVSAWQAYTQKLPRASFPFIEELDALSRKYSLGLGAAEFSTAHLSCAFSREKLWLAPLEDKRFFFSQSNIPLDMPISGYNYFIVPTEGKEKGVDPSLKTLALKVNGFPKEVIPLSNGMELLLYDNAKLASLAETYLSTRIFSPDPPKDDELIWHGLHRFKQGAELTEGRYVFRHGRSYLVCLFANPPKELNGVKLSVAVIGDKTSAHRQKIWEWFAASPSGPLAPFFWLLLQARDCPLLPVFVGPYLDGSVAVIRTPNRESTQVKALFLTLNGELFRLR